MPTVNLGYCEVDLNGTSIAVIDAVMNILAIQPMGTALVIGENAVFLLPDGNNKTNALGDLTYLPCTFDFENEYKAQLYELSHFISDDSEDEFFRLIANDVDNPKFLKIKQWKRLFFRYCQDIETHIDEDEREQIEEAFSNGTLTLDLFDEISFRKIPRNALA